MHRSRVRSIYSAGPCMALVILLAGPVASLAAGDGQNPAASPSQPERPTADFLFGPPRGSIGFRGSWLVAREGSDLFDFLEDQLTVDNGAFNRPAFAMDLGMALTSRVDVVVGFEVSKASVGSEYRRYVDNNFLPITQRTTLKEVDLTASVRIALLPRGREVSRFAWVPRDVTPYVGGGAGYSSYKFEQTGDFVDYVDLSVFGDRFASSGWTPSAHLFGGADIRVYRRLFFTVEGRYLWAAGKLGSDFVGFDPIDLDGLRLAAGVNVLF